MKSHNGMRPQDIVILLKILTYPDSNWQYRDIAASLALSISEISDYLYEWISVHLDHIEQRRVNYILGGLMNFVSSWIILFELNSNNCRDIESCHTVPQTNKVSPDLAWQLFAMKLIQYRISAQQKVLSLCARYLQIEIKRWNKTNQTKICLNIIKYGNHTVYSCYRSCPDKHFHIRSTSKLFFAKKLKHLTCSECLENEHLSPGLISCSFRNWDSSF